MDCKYLTVIKEKHYCKIASELSGGLQCETTQEACKACIESSSARSPNSVTASLATKAVKEQTPEKLPEIVKQLSHLYRIYTSSQENKEKGPGTELKKILSWFATETPDCECKDRANKMNIWGVQGCRDNIETILDWLQEEAVKRSIPFVRLIAKQLVLLAISRAEKCTQNDASLST